MAEYVKQRALAAKVGVSMAMLGLLAGLGIKAKGDAQTPVFVQEASANSFVKFEKKLNNEYKKLDKTFISFQKAVNSKILKVYDKSSIDATFLKQGDAASQYLKIDGAASQYLKIDGAASQYLKIQDASAKFLPIGGTAGNAAELGGLTPDAFFQGHGTVVSGAQTVNGDGMPAPLLTSPDGAISILIGLSNANAAQVTVMNNTGQTRTIIVVCDGAPTTQVVGANGQGTPITLTPANGGGGQCTIQALPNGASNEVATAVISGALAQPGAVGASFAGQMLIGLL